MKVLKAIFLAAAISVEKAMSGAYFLKEGKKRGYKIDINIESID